MRGAAKTAPPGNAPTLSSAAARKHHVTVRAEAPCNCACLRVQVSLGDALCAQACTRTVLGSMWVLGEGAGLLLSC